MKQESDIIAPSLDEDHDRNRMWRIALTSFPMMLITATSVIVLLQISGMPGTIEDTQLGFNAEVVRSHLLTMDEEHMRFFILGNLVDYLFMISYGIFFYSCSLLLSSNYRKGILKTVGILFAWIGVLAACSDGFENLFLLSMTADPAGFPDWLALAHSSFALFKFILMYSAIGWLVVSFILNQTPLVDRVVRQY